MHIKLKVYEVSATGDAAVVREALAPVLEAMGVTLGDTMSMETVAFLAAHGFTVEDYHRGRKGAEDVEAFVARRELEQAGIKFTRVVHRRPGVERRVAIQERTPLQLAELDERIEAILRAATAPAPTSKCKPRKPAPKRGKRGSR